MINDDSEIKAELLAIGLKLLQGGLVLGSSGNISTRATGADCCWITPSGIPYDQLTPDDLVLVGLDGEVRQGRLRPSSETPMHTACYQQRPEVGGIVHTHSTFASVFAVNRREVPLILEEMVVQVGGAVQVASYALPGSEELAVAALVAMGKRNAVLLANHGLVGVGQTITEALLVCQLVEKSAQVYLLAQGNGIPYVFSESEVTRLHEYLTGHYGQHPGREVR